MNAATSIFLYGAPGNGKTAVAERITAMIGGAIFIPHAIEVDGAIVMLFDELNHTPIEAPGGRKYDGRWQRIKRPRRHHGRRADAGLAGPDLERHRVDSTRRRSR